MCDLRCELWLVCCIVRRAAKRIQRPWGEKERGSPLRAKREQNFQDLETTAGLL